MTYTFRPAARSQTKPLIGLYGPSGSGKTYSALMLARGFVGSEGRIGVIDTESGRSELYSDVIPGGFLTARLGEPFSPKAYVEAIRAAEAAKLDALVIDSFSHEWEGVGGVLEMAAEIEQRTGKPGLHCWKAPKMEHQRLVLRLLQTPLFVICCLRAKYKSRQVKTDRGKTEIVRDEHATAIQDEGFLFELTVNAELQRDNTMHITKTSPGLERVFVNGQKINLDTGRALAEWARGGSAPAQSSRAAPPAPASDAPADDAGAGHSAEEPVALDDARAVATEGTEALRRYWKTLSAEQRAALEPYVAGLKAAAAQADQPAGADA